VGARDVYIVAHSFGTLIVSEALRAFAGKKRLKGVILCGSPLPHDYNIDHIINASEQTINDCGTRDFVLIAARLLLLGLGDAGRVGFVREDTGSFMNRYFAGGHGLYFRSDPGTVSFFEKHWLKFLALSQPPRHADCRRSFVGQDIVHVALNVLTALKPCWYGLLAIAIGRLTYDALLF
jgi:pimeloyl-ACP methyl ester carboxylesterase